MLIFYVVDISLLCGDKNLIHYNDLWFEEYYLSMNYMVRDMFHVTVILTGENTPHSSWPIIFPFISSHFAFPACDIVAEGQHANYPS